MRFPTILLFLSAILAASCASSPDSASPQPGTSSQAARSVPTSGDVSKVKGHAIHVVWRNLNPRYGEQEIGLVNRTSPQVSRLYGKPGVKVVADDVMADLVQAFRQSDFFDLAVEGKDASAFEMGDGHYVISLTDGDKSWALLRPRMDPSEARSSSLPETTRNLKVLIMNVNNATWSPTISTGDDPNRVFRAPTPDRRR